MDKFATLEPVKLYTSPGSVPSPKFPRFTSQHKPPAPFQLIGRLPVDIHILILVHASIPDLPALSRVSRAFGNLCKDERVWEVRWTRFVTGNLHLAAILDDLENKAKTQNAVRKSSLPPTLSLDGGDDDFMATMRMRRAFAWPAPIAFFLLAHVVHASLGDRLPEFKECLKACTNNPRLRHAA